jgi:hypothetical protein
LAVLRHRLTKLTATIFAEPAAKNAQQRLPDEPDTQPSASLLIPVGESGESCPFL